MNESTALAANKYLRTAYIKGLILMRDYAEIAGLADGSSGTEELIIIAELYIDGYIKDKDFKSDYVKSQSTALEAVVDRCRSIMDGEFPMLRSRFASHIKKNSNARRTARFERDWHYPPRPSCSCFRPRMTI